MVARERELTGYGRHPFVYSISYHVALILADPGASEGAVFPGPLGEFR